MQPDSAFSKEIFKTIRPQIPRRDWPENPITALFLPLPDGSGLVAEFESFPSNEAKVASQLILARGPELVLKSPAKRALIDMYRSKSWRDVCLYSLLPMLFAVIMLNAVSAHLSRLTATPLILDLCAIIALHFRLGVFRSRLENARFIARIPTPGLHIKLENDPDSA